LEGAANIERRHESKRSPTGFWRGTNGWPENSAYRTE
jgi:hypothetical protein